MTISVKKIDFIKTFLIFILFVGIVLIPTASAAGSISDFPSYMLSQINDGVSNTIKKILTNEDGNNQFYKMMISNETDEMSATLKSAMAIITVIACLKIFVETFKSVAHTIERGMDIAETFFKASAGFLLRLILITRINDILSLIIDLGTWVVSQVSSIAPDVITDAITLEQLTGHSKGGITWWIQSTVILLIPFVFSIMMCLTATFASYSILIEIGLRKAMSPLAIVSIFDEGFRSPGARALKKLLAQFFRIALCLIVCAVGSELMSIALEEVLSGGNVLDSLAGCFTYVLKVIAINLTVLAFINKSAEIANDAVSV